MPHGEELENLWNYPFTPKGQIVRNRRIQGTDLQNMAKNNRETDANFHEKLALSKSLSHK